MAFCWPILLFRALQISWESFSFVIGSKSKAGEFPLVQLFPWFINFLVHMLFELQRLGFFWVVSGKSQQVVVELRAGLIIIIISIRVWTIAKSSGKPHHLFSQELLAVSHVTLSDERVARDISWPIAEHWMNFHLNCYFLSFCPSRIQDKISS
jgi:hypothetical protein